MILEVIKYKKANISIRYVLLGIGLGCILYGFFNSALQILCGKIFVLCVTFFLMIKFLCKNYRSIGSINLNGNNLKLEVEKKIIDLKVPENVRDIRFYKSGYKDESYNYHFTSVGMLTFKNGINKLVIQNDGYLNFKVLILIRNESQVKDLITQLMEYQKSGIRIIQYHYNVFAI